MTHAGGCRRFATSACLLLATACASLGSRAPVEREKACNQLNLPDSSLLALHQSDSTEYPYQKFAERVYLYAQMADNAYLNGPWALPDSVRDVRSVDDPSGTGFAATIFEVGHPGGALSSVVISFRGTEGPFFISRDWWYGNFRRVQQRQAEDYYWAVRKQYPESVPIVATGHSLGGALALQVSLADTVDAYVFNSSYRVVRRSPYPLSDRLSVAERGEAVTPVRWLLRNLTLLHLPSFDCTQGGPIANHGMTPLARCLTRFAAARVPGARESLDRNRLECTATDGARPAAAGEPGAQTAYLPN